MFTASNLIQYVADPEFPSKSLAPLTRIPTMGLDKIFGNSTVDIGIFIALLFAFIVYVILEKTTFGFELKACGFNRNAARYAGVNDKRGIVLSMTIAGALAGLAGGLVYISAITKVLDKILALPTEGFDGITVALLSLSNPIGSIFSAVFISFIKNAGGSLTLSGFNEDIIKIMTAVIIYMSAFSIIFKERINKYFTKKVVK
jgi:simple sugar transport system permease protein